MAVEGLNSAFETATNESAREGNILAGSQMFITERDPQKQIGLPHPSPDITQPPKGSRVIDYLKSEEFIVACGSRGTSSQGRITRVQPATSKKNVVSNYKKTIREKMLFESDTNQLFDS